MEGKGKNKSGLKKIMPLAQKTITTIWLKAN
jgi:hypothetical protein